MRIKGLNELEKKLVNMEKKVAKKIVRKAVRNAQKICLKEAKANALSMVGGEMGSKIASALKVQATKKQRKGSYQLQVAIDKNKADEFKHETKGGETYYIPTAIEYGHKGDSGDVPAIAFILNAADSTERKRIKKFANEVGKGIDSA